MSIFTYNIEGILQHPDVQTLLSSSPIRKKWATKRAYALLENSKRILHTTDNGIVIETFIHTPTNHNNRLVILLHGWEGSANSSYLLSAAKALFDSGFIIGRINFRDHGDTHHLNQTPFNSVRLREIVDTVEEVFENSKAKSLNLVGFSLGGNFALRLAANKSIQALPLTKVLSICPAINPVTTSATIENGNPIYHRYFVKKWKRSLHKKYQYYPEIMRSHHDLNHKTLNTMNWAFVPLHTGYDKPEVYLSAYKISQEIIANIKAESAIIYSVDDPVINAEDFKALEKTEQVTFYPQDHGGHCAFLKNWKLESWVEDVAKQFFN